MVCGTTFRRRARQETQMMHDPMERALLSRIAWAYYVEGMTQSDVDGCMDKRDFDF